MIAQATHLRPLSHVISNQSAEGWRIVRSRVTLIQNGVALLLLRCSIACVVYSSHLFPTRSLTFWNGMILELLFGFKLGIEDLSCLWLIHALDVSHKSFHDLTLAALTDDVLRHNVLILNQPLIIILEKLLEVLNKLRFRTVVLPSVDQ